MSKAVRVEVCLDSVESAVAAERGGADRVELCDNLLEGGTTPSLGMIAATREKAGLGLMVMIRPRGGDFRYSAAELDVMARDVVVAKEHGADGVVFGVLEDGGVVDEAATARLVELARPMQVTFHRAFDVTRDPVEALETLVRLGVDRVLTSGQEAHVLEGLDLLAELVERAGERILVMPGCGITAKNASKVLRATRAREIHVVGTTSIESTMAHRNPRVFMGTEIRTPEYSRTVTSESAVKAIVAAT